MPDYDVVLDMASTGVNAALVFLSCAAVVAAAVLLLERMRMRRKLRQAEMDLRNARQLLMQHEKLAELGQLTAGIAHEIKNPLNFVNNFSSLSKDLINDYYTAVDAVERDEILKDLKSNLDKIEHHSKRADRIVQSMLQHSRGNKGEKQPTDINRLCDEYTDLAYHGMRAGNTSFNCQVSKNFDSTLPPVMAVPQDVSRVILNLLSNAFYAVKSKPNALVEVSTQKQNNYAVIKIKDNGSGMTEETRQKLFQPFYTTKPAGEGTGLGLSMSHDIVTKEHGGTIAVDSKLDEYTEFTVMLPM